MAKIKQPTLAQDVFEYNGQAQSPTIQGFDSKTMIQSGNTQATEIGDYTINVGLKDISVNAWEDNSTDPFMLPWSITSPKEDDTSSDDEKKVVTFEHLKMTKDYIDKKAADNPDLTFATNEEVEAMFR